MEFEEEKRGNAGACGACSSLKRAVEGERGAHIKCRKEGKFWREDSAKFGRFWRGMGFGHLSPSFKFQPIGLQYVANFFLSASPRPYHSTFSHRAFGGLKCHLSFMGPDPGARLT